MGRLRTAVIATCALAVLVPTTASAKGKNPYTAKGLCGSSFKVIERKPLRAVSPLDGKNHLLATAVLMYSGATGENCAVLLKRRRIDKPDNLNITLITRPRSDVNSDGDGGLDLGYFAGPARSTRRTRRSSGGAGPCRSSASSTRRSRSTAASAAAGCTAAEPRAQAPNGTGARAKAPQTRPPGRTTGSGQWRSRC